MEMKNVLNLLGRELKDGSKQEKWTTSETG
jgi:hypothetical protein